MMKIFKKLVSMAMKKIKAWESSAEGVFIALDLF
jgi:hypothetical protein